jgi:lariat debranching enzyme
MDVDPPTPSEEVVLTFDPAWLAITRAFHPLLSLSTQASKLPEDLTVIKGTIDRELAWIKANLKDGGRVPILEVQQFVKTAPAPGDPKGDSKEMRTFARRCRDASN